MLSLGLMALGIIGYGYASFVFAQNTQAPNHDMMGASIGFDTDWLLASLPVIGGIVLQLNIHLVWRCLVAIMLLIVLPLAGYVYKWWILDKLLRRFR